MLKNRLSVAGIVVLGFLALLQSAGGSDTTIEIEIRDATPFHVFPAGEPFSFGVLATQSSGRTPGKLAYQWRDLHGDPLGPEIPFTPGVPFNVDGPSQNPLPGYYGLAFVAEPDDVVFNQSSGARREIGFTVLPRRWAAREMAPEQSQFGVVHADLDDPYLPTWVKTLTWHTLRPGEWGTAMKRRDAAGLQELPIVLGDGWSTDDRAPVSAEFLARLEDRIRQYFAADPTIEFWELGLEENLADRFAERAYFDNLAVKASTVRHVMQDINPRARLLYQVAGRNPQDIAEFLASDAASSFDILALHPYAWPHFPTPEKWLAAFIDDAQREMSRQGIRQPIWMTEFGAPANDPGVMFMYSGYKPVRALQRADQAAYLVKAHVIALERGVEKIFWYNYRDRGGDVLDPEDHFGLVDHWGFPKPAYAAYATMIDCLEGKVFRNARATTSDIRIYEFADDKERCFVLWSYPDSMQAIALSTIDPGLDVEGPLTATNMDGSPLSTLASIDVGSYPIFVKVADASQNGTVQ